MTQDTNNILKIQTTSRCSNLLLSSCERLTPMAS